MNLPDFDPPRLPLVTLTVHSYRSQLFQSMHARVAARLELGPSPPLRLQPVYLAAGVAVWAGMLGARYDM
jgi:hypothetical protein